MFILRFISNNKRAFRKFHIPSRRTVSKIIRKTGNPPHRNGINRHHAAEKPQDVPPICIPGRLPLSLQTPIGLSPLFRKKRKPSPRPEVLRFADPIRNGLPSPVSSGGTLSTPVRIRSSPRFQPLSHFFIMAKLERLVIHCTATPPGREVSAADIRRWHTARPHPPGRQRRTARSQQRRPHGRSLGDHQRRLRLQRHQPPHRIRRRSRRRRHDPLRYPHSAAKERPRTLRPGFRRPISRRSRRRA